MIFYGFFLTAAWRTEKLTIPWNPVYDCPKFRSDIPEIRPEIPDIRPKIPGIRLDIPKI